MRSWVTPATLPAARPPTWKLGKPMVAQTDPAVVVRSVRAVALEAHRLLKDPAPHAAQTDDLLRRIELIQGQLHVDHSSELSRWLVSLRRRIAES